jgi:hypothetical protein
VSQPRISRPGGLDLEDLEEAARRAWEITVSERMTDLPASSATPKGSDYAPAEALLSIANEDSNDVDDLKRAALQRTLDYKRSR